MEEKRQATLVTRMLSIAMALMVATTISLGTSMSMQETAYAASAKPTIKVKSPRAITLEKGKTSKIKIKVTKGAKVTYKSSKKSVAEVSKKGVVTAKKAGKAKITIKAKKGKKTAKTTITVTVKAKSKAKTGTNASNSAAQEKKKFEEFAAQAAEIVKSADEDLDGKAAEQDEFYSARLIVKDDGTDIDFSAHDPKAVAKYDGLNIVQYDSSKTAKAAMSELENNAHVVWVEPDASIEAVDSDLATGSIQQQGFHSWGVKAIGADKLATSLSKSSNSATVAVVDTGVSSHPLIGSKLLGGYDFVNNDSDPADENRHGTHVAGTIAECTSNTKTSILPVRVLNAKGTGWSSIIALGIDYATKNGADVINLSLGGGCNNDIDEAIERAVKSGVTVCAAAGNENSDTSYYSPAHIGNIIVVGAIDSNNEKAWFSNVGNSVDVVAPGVSIESSVPNNDYATLNGTSMATPHVAAAAALVKIKTPASTPAQIEQTLKNCATDLGASGWDRSYGYGIPNLSKLVVDEKPKTYTVKFNANGGSGSMSNQTFTVNTSANLSANAFTRSGYSFAGWNTQANGSGASYADRASVRNLASANGSITLYAQWSATESYLTVAEGPYKFKCQNGGYMIDVPNGKNTNNLTLFTWKDNGLIPQRFVVARVSNGTYTIQSCCSGKYLADYNASLAQQTKSSSSNQQWHFLKSGSNVLLKNAGTGRYVTVTSTATKTNLVTQASVDTAKQQIEMTSAQIMTNGYYKLPSLLGKNLDVTAASKDNNANVQLYTANETNAQKWYFTHKGNGYYTLTNAASNKALAVYGSSNSEGANVVQASLTGAASQLWYVRPSVHGGIELINKQSGKALSVPSNKNDDGANVAQSSAASTVNQGWYPQETTKIASSSRTVNVGINVTETVDYNGVKSVSIPNGTYLIRNAAGGYLDVSKEDISAGANVQIWAKTGSPAQYWIFRNVGDGYYTISCAYSALRLDAVDGGMSNGTNVRQWERNNGDAERWRPEILGNQLVFVNKHGGRALDVEGASSANGTNVHVWDRNDTIAQRWTLSKASFQSGTKTVRIGDYNVVERTNDDGHVTVEIPNGTYSVQHIAGRYLDVAGASTYGGANVHIWEANGSSAQHWIIRSLSDGFYTLACECSGHMLDVLNGSGANGTNVQQCVSNGSTAQRWFARIVNGSIVFVNQGNGRALDVTDAVNANGQNVQVWERHDGDAQRWLLRTPTRS